jgi:hypothetical protein
MSRRWKNIPAIYLVSDGRDALVSHAHFVMAHDRNIPPHEKPHHFESILRALITSDASFGGWSGNVSAWLERKILTLVIRFEALIADPFEVVRQALAAVGYSVPAIASGTIPTFDEMHAKAPTIFRKGRVNSWKEEIPETLPALFWERHGDVMRRLGYTPEP